MIYLDNAAGTPPARSVLEKACAAAEKFYAHPQALHAPAATAAEHLLQTRRRAARILAVKTESLIFVAGASEANCLLAQALKRTYPEARLASLNIDHDSWRIWSDYTLAVNRQNAQLEAAQILKIADDVVCLSLAGINNELGVIQPFATIKRAFKELRDNRLKRGNHLPLWLHVDASQMALIHNVQPQALADADFLTLNGAKFYALRRSALLYLKPGLRLHPPWHNASDSWQLGGESLFLAEALTSALERIEGRRLGQSRRLKALQARFEARLEALGGQVVIKHCSARSPHLTSVIFKGRDNERLALQLSQEGIHIGIGSACRSRSDLLETSALKALGYGADEIYGALRFSFAYETRQRQLTLVLKVLKRLLEAENR